MRRLAFARAARHDLVDIIDYVALDSPSGAESLFRTIVAAAEELLTFPTMGRTGRMPNTRELIVVGTPYLLVYQVTSTAATVVAVFHGARDLVRASAERRGDMPSDIPTDIPEASL